MNGIHRWLLCAGVLAVTACAGTTERGRGPDWVSGAAEAYSVSSYLLGRGSADTLDRAEDRARADIAKIFEVRIRGATREEQTFKEASGPDGRQAKASLEITRSLELRTDSVVSGIEIAETWHDRRNDTYHALAVLRRAPAANRLRADLSRLDDATRGAIGRARAMEDPLAAITEANRAVQLQIERGAVQRMLRVLDPTGKGEPSPWELESLRADRDALIARVRVRPETRGETAPELEEVLAGAVGEAGFTVVTDNPDFVLTGSLSLIPLDRIDEWYWIRGFLDVTLRERSGPVRGEHRWNIKASARDPRTARKRAFDQVASTLDRELLTTLIDLIPQTTP